MLKIDRNALPERHLLISVSDGEVYRYNVCGLEDVFVQGGFERHPSFSGWSRLTNVEWVNEQIGDFILGHESLSAQHFRFLRKEAGLTIEQLSLHMRVNVSELRAWESGEGFAPIGVEAIRGIYQQFRDLGYVGFQSLYADQREVA